MRIHRAEDDDLLALSNVFLASAAHLNQQYAPEHVERVPPDPEARLPIYRHLLATGAMFVAEDPGPVGFSAAIMREGVWFLSQLWVLPERHGAGIGSRLLDEALAWGRGATAFTVISSPHPGAQLLYLRASMYPLWAQLDLMRSGASAAEAPEGFDELTEGDQGWIDELDREVRGIRRPEDHGFWRAQAVGLALRRDGIPAGYVYVWPDGKVGPAAVHDPRDLAAVIRAALHRVDGPAAFGVPSTNWAALRDLAREGFAPQGSSFFMASRPIADGSRYLSSGGALA